MSTYRLLQKSSQHIILQVRSDFNFVHQTATYYLQERFDRRLRPFVSITSGISHMIYLSIALYAPSLALSQVTGLDIHYTIFLIGCVSTFYTTLGGMKAVLWADAVQSVVMVLGLLMVIIVGIWKVGGIQEVWRIADEGGRINFWNFDPNPLERSTFFTYVVCGFFRVLNPYISSQVWVQRYGTLHTAKQAQLAVYLNIPMYIGMSTLFTLTGLVLFATYHKCDPFLAGRITKLDQMMPLLVSDMLADLPGFTGLFLACLCCASLSTTSSGQNSLAATFLADIAKPIYHQCTRRHLGIKRSTLVAEVTAALLGGVIILMAYVIVEWKSTLFHLTTQMTGMLFGPVAGMFILGMLIPMSDTQSVVGGCVVALAVSWWLGVGSILQTTRAPSVLSTSIGGCPVNATVISTDTILDSTTASTYVGGYDNMTTTFRVTDLYRISPLMFSALGTTLTVVVGTLLACLSNFIRRRCACKQSKEDDLRNSRDEVCMRPILTGGPPYHDAVN
ncbi:Sodium-coupled monocarboxylate transporter 1 [Lamellibrachia satsuma]|nr:Sodium-coupled monocarboxylate transporter 1 [Lamellibrachia satsuma]